MGRSPVLSIAGLEKAFGRARVLEGVDFAVAAGQFVVLLGRPGAGKSTLLGAIAGLVPFDRGNLTVLGRDVGRRRYAAESVGIVFEHSVIDLDRSLSANLLYYAALRGLDPKRARLRVNAAIDRLSLGRHRHDAVKVLGPSNRRRVEIARALLHGPRLLLVDEGGAGLDSEGRRQVLDDARAAASHGTAVVWATPRPDEVDQNDGLAVLDHGRIAFSGAPSAFIAERNAETLDAAYRTLRTKADEGDRKV